MMSARLAAILVLVSAIVGSARDGVAAPRFTADGSLLPPADYREWVFLSSGLDMSYAKTPMTMGHSMFNNVFADPASYRSFLQTGHWPDGTMLVLESRVAGTAEPPLRKGTYQTGDIMGVEVHVRDSRRFPSGWAFYGFDGDGPGKKVADRADCEICHQSHAAVDTTFVQFYPTLLPTARRLGTLSAGYLSDKATPK